ncbi:MAG: metallophosphoesterase family protein, partial [Actinomycetota bacterium]
MRAGPRARRATTSVVLALGLTLLAALVPQAASSAGGLAPAADIVVAGDPVIAAAGDIACDPAVTSPSRCHSSDTADVIRSINPHAVLALGDLQYPTGTFDDFMAGYEPTWGAFKSITYPAVGDNEYLSSSGADGYFDYWNGQGDTSGRAGDRGKGYYSFDIGTWHVVALNSQKGLGSSSSQAQWLKGDLAAHANTCTLAYWHEPRFSSERGHQTESLDALYTILYTAGVDVLLTGHL